MSRRPVAGAATGPVDNAVGMPDGLLSPWARDCLLRPLGCMLRRIRLSSGKLLLRLHMHMPVVHLGECCACPAVQSYHRSGSMLRAEVLQRLTGWVQHPARDRLAPELGSESITATGEAAITPQSVTTRQEHDRQAHATDIYSSKDSTTGTARRIKQHRHTPADGLSTASHLSRQGSQQGGGILAGDQLTERGDCGQLLAGMRPQHRVGARRARR